MYVTEILRNIKFQANEMLILLGYLIAHGGVFILMPAIYWDDWVLYNQETSEILSRFEMAGAAFGIYGHVHAFMQLLGPAGYKLLTFFMFFGSIILCYKILLRQEWISQKSCYLIALLFAVLPFNFARIMEISLPYSLSNFLFFSGWYLLFRSKIIAILLFILAFSVPSFLVFYLLPVAEMLRRDVFLHTFSWKSDSLKKIIAWVVKNVVIVTLPIAYFFIKNLYYSPSGFYAGYNEEFSAYKIWPALKMVYSDFMGQDISLPLLLVGFLLGLAFLPRGEENIFNRRLLAMGFFTIGLALFPYLILGLAPTFDEWTASRHQLLLPLGCSLFIVGIAGYLSPVRSRFFISFVLAVSFAMSFKFYHVAYLDWAKQVAVIEFLRDSDLREADVILFDDRTESRFGRVIGFYEWSGLVKLAYGDQKRIAMRSEEYPNYLSGKYDRYFLPMYNAGSHRRSTDNVVRVLVIDYIKIWGENSWLGKQKYSLRIFPLK